MEVVSTEATARIPVEVRRGIHLPEAQLWLDPWDARPRAIVTHAHSDHFAPHGTVVCSTHTARLIEARFHGAYVTEAHRFGRAWTENGHSIRLLPAGHTLGSAQVHVTRLSDGATLLYSGDFKLRRSRTSEAARTERADMLIMETTFGLPQFRFPGTARIRNAMVKFCRACLDNDEVPVLIGYALGKTQEILAQLADGGFAFALHPACHEMTRAYQAAGLDFPEFERLGPETDVSGKVLIVPPSAARSQALRRIRNRRLALCSGWALTPGAKYRYQVDEVFPLSDHADFPELLRYVEAVAPRLVLTTHGYAGEFARILRERGVEAWSLGADDQMEFTLGFDGEEPGEGEEADPLEAPASEFGRFVRACDEIASSSSRLQKVELLAGYLRSLADADKVALGARCFVGRAVAGREEQKQVATGWAIIRLALIAATGLSPQRCREISRGQNDAGRAAYLMLVHAPRSAPADFGLEVVEQCVRRLIEARGPTAKAAVMETFFRQMSAPEGSYLVKILTGDMRIGLKEGLVEEGIALAFGAPPAQVREVHMLTGDIGETARLAALGRLDSAQLSVFQPVRPMLASPEESAEDIVTRMGEASQASAAGAPVLWIEDKFDGIRAQLHKCGSRAELFSRDLRSLSAEFPDIARPALQLDDDVVLDGEIIAHAEGRRLDFFSLQKRLGRREPDLFLREDVPVRFIAFDLLWHNGATLLTRPLAERRRLLESLRLVRPLEIIALATVPLSALAVDAEFLRARQRGNEGLIVKDPSSPYVAGRRGKSWLKLKQQFLTLDVVVVRVEQGHGRRSHMLSDYTFAVRDEASGGLRVIGKAYSGLTDREIEEMTEFFTTQTVAQHGSARDVLPTVVIEVAFQSIQPSQRHDSGLALRFPRIRALRRDKSVEEIDTLATARRLAGLDP